MGLTADETAREVRAQVAWGKGAEEVRSVLARKGAARSDVEEALRDSLSRSNAEFRSAGFLGIIIGGALMFAAWKLGGAWIASLRPHAPGDLASAQAMTDGMMPGRVALWRPVAALILLGIGVARLTTGVHRLVTGGRGDRSR